MRLKIIIPAILITILIVVSVILIINNKKPEPIFDGYLRVPINYSYSDTCYPAGEIMAVIPGNKCCDNLNGLGIIDEGFLGCEFLSGIILCSDCGNSICDFAENNCNCPEDC